jgi:hypothetical protein
MCDFELLLVQTPVGVRTVNTGTSIGRLLRKGRTQRLSLVRLRPYIFLYFICTRGRQATVVSPLKRCDFFFAAITQLLLRALQYTYNRPFHSGSTTVRGQSKRTPNKRLNEYRR